MDILKDYIDANPDEFKQLTDEQMTALHSELLDMIDDIQTFCHMHGLTLYASGGTALGTLRHKGFIPWDEDVDFTMLRHDCNVFLANFEKEYEGKYFIEAPNHTLVGNHVFIKVKKHGTKMTDLLTKKGCSGICIDIFPIDYASNNKLVRAIQGSRYMILRSILYVVSFSRQYKLLMKEGMKKCPFKTRLISRLGVGFGRLCDAICPLEKRINKYDKLVRRDKPTRYWAIASGIHSYWKETFTEDVYLPNSSGTFEGREITLPGKIETILKSFYGDYMTPPPENKRAKHFFMELETSEKG